MTVGDTGPGCRAPRRAVHTAGAGTAWYACGMNFRRMSLSDLAGQVRAGTLGAREVVAHALERIDALDGQVHAFVSLDADGALEAARRIDEAVAAGEDPGPLAGVPIGVKDLEDAAGLVTSHGSALFAGGAAGRRRLPLGGAPAGGWVRGGGEDQHARARLEGGHRQRHLRAHPQPVEPRPQPGRLVGRLGRRHRGGHGAPRHGVRRRRIDPHPRLVLRVERDQAVARPCAGRRTAHRQLVRPVHQGAHGAARGRRRRRPRRRGGTGPDRPALASPARGVVARSPRLGPAPGQGGVVAHARLRPARRRGAGPVRAGRGPARADGCRGGGDRHGVRRGPGGGLAHPGAHLQPADAGAVPGHRGVGARRSPVGGAGGLGGRAPERAGGGTGARRLPPSQPAAGGVVPRRAAAHHPDVCGAATTALAQRPGTRERGARRQLGALHLPVQHDALPGGVGVRRVAARRDSPWGSSWWARNTPTWW